MGAISKPQGGDSIEVASGGSVNIGSGASLDIKSGAALKFAGVEAPAGVTFTPAAGAANVCDVVVAVTSASGAALAGVRNLRLWLSDAATGAGLTGTSASGTVTAASGEGTVLATHTAKKDLTVQTKAAGTFTLEITDGAKTGFYVCAEIPGRGVIAVSAQLVTADYGSGE